ncbi:MAG: hypothetical protein K9K37_09955 [Desulfocapsa sp.]|nr:hypothetical protein [Desulfocapsa sp.]
MRPSALLFSLIAVIILVDTLFWAANRYQKKDLETKLSSQQRLVGTFGLTDLALSTEARYTRHPAVTDSVAPFMDHPGSIEHFPSGSFILPVAVVGR